MRVAPVSSRRPPPARTWAPVDERGTKERSNVNMRHRPSSKLSKQGATKEHLAKPRAPEAASAKLARSKVTLGPKTAPTSLEARSVGGAQAREEDTWINAIRDQQVRLASRLGAVIAGEIREKLPRTTGDLQRLLGLEKLPDIPAPLLEHEALKELLQTDVERDTLEAVIGWTDWVATKVVRPSLAGVPREERSQLRRENLARLVPETLDLPPSTELDHARFESEYGVSRALIERVDSLLRREPKLPLLGALEPEDGVVRLRVDRDALGRWAAGYDWTA